MDHINVREREKEKKTKANKYYHMNIIYKSKLEPKIFII
jgi:hypothetical protein